MTTISQVLAKATSHRDWQEKLLRYRLWNNWQEIVGEHIALNAEPLRWQGKTLIVGVRSSAWMQELSMMKGDLLQKIRTAYPKLFIKEVRFELAQLSDKRSGTISQHQESTLSADQEAFIEKTVSTLQDEGMRQAIRNIMRHDLSRNRSSRG